MTDRPTKDVIYKKVNGIWKELGPGRPMRNEDKKKTNEYSIKNLDNISLIDLEELLKRQEKILANKRFISKLPDYGEKLQSRLNELKCAYRKRGQLFTSNETAIENSIERLEWNRVQNRQITQNNKIPSNEIPRADNSDLYEDENINPLELLASHSVDVPKITYKSDHDYEDLTSAIQEELDNLHILDDQNKEVELANTNCLLSTPSFSQVLVKKSEQNDKRCANKNKFRTNRPLRPHIPAKKDLASPLWIEVEATGGLVQKSTTKSITLSESLLLMEKAHKSQMDILHENTKIALQEMSPTHIGLPERDFTRYRDVNTDHHILDDSDEESYEPLAYGNGRDVEYLEGEIQD